MSTQAWLVLRGVSPSLWSFPITTERQTIGRQRSCSIQIVHDTVSREHAEVWLAGDQLHVHDLGSSNGTRINDARIDEAQFVIGDTLRLGDVMLDVTAQELIDESSVFFERQPTKVSDTDQSPSEAILQGLSGAQRRVLRLLLTGQSEKEVAEELHISPHTVHSHVKQIYKQFHVGSRAELMAFFIDHAVISRTT